MILVAPASRRQSGGVSPAAGPHPIPSRHPTASNQNFSVLRKLHFTPGQNLADRSLPQLKWMIHAHQRCRLRESVPLNHRKSQSVPELLRVTVESCPAGNKSPKLPPEPTVQAAEDPSSAQKLFTFRILEPGTKRIRSPGVLLVPFDFLFQRLQHARHCHQHGNPLPPNRLQHFRRSQGALKNHGSRHKRRKKHPKELSEHMAQRQQVQKPHRMHPAFVLQILPNLSFQRRRVRQDIAVSDHDSLRLGCRSRRENNFQRIAFAQRGQPREAMTDARRGWYATLPESAREPHLQSARVSTPSTALPTSRVTRSAKSSVAASSIGTAITPSSAHPRNAATHSAQFSPQIKTRSPFAISRASSSREN